jgi:hypothetical protein
VLSSQIVGIGSSTGYLLTDTIAPTVSSFSPADNLTNVSTGSDIVVTFSEAIRRGYGTILLKTADGTLIQSFDHTDPDLYFTGNTLTINPAAYLTPSTAYVVEFAPGSVVDLAGNSYLGTNTYDFTTGVTAVDDYLATTATTGSLSVGSSITGRIDSATDSDWFAINLTAGQSYSFFLGSQSNVSEYWLLSLINGSGTSVAVDYGHGDFAKVVYTASSSGTYYLDSTLNW